MRHLVMWSIPQFLTKPSKFWSLWLGMSSENIRQPRSASTVRHLVVSWFFLFSRQGIPSWKSASLPMLIMTIFHRFDAACTVCGNGFFYFSLLSLVRPEMDLKNYVRICMAFMYLSIESWRQKGHLNDQREPKSSIWCQRGIKIMKIIWGMESNFD